MATVGTIKKYNEGLSRDYVLLLTSENEELICSIKKQTGLGEGTHVAVDGVKIDSLLLNAKIQKLNVI